MLYFNDFIAYYESLYICSQTLATSGDFSKQFSIVAVETRASFHLYYANENDKTVNFYHHHHHHRLILLTTKVSLQKNNYEADFQRGYIAFKNIT